MIHAIMEVSDDESRSRYDTAGMYRGARCRPSVRRRRSADSFCSAFDACAPRTCVQEKSGFKSESARPEAESQALGLSPRFPRQGLIDCFRPRLLASQLRIGKPFTDDLTNADVKSLSIGHLAIVESERLFIDGGTGGTAQR